MGLVCCPYLRVSTIEQNNGVAIERMIFEVEQAARSIGGEIPEDLILIDLMSGRRDDRPGFLQLIELIETRRIDVVIIYRVDRLSRDAGTLLELKKLLIKTGVRVYACERSKLLDWNNLEDKRFWNQASIKSEDESSVISDRLKKAHAFNHYKGQAALRVPFGYRRVDRKYRLNPETVEQAKQQIKIIREEKGNTTRIVARVFQELGLRRSAAGISQWIANPVLRGHTYYASRGETKYNTHPNDRLLTEKEYQEIQLLLGQRKIYRGVNAEKEPAPLSGLCWCTCGCTCSVVRQEGKKARITCQTYKSTHGKYEHTGKRSLLYSTIEEQVLEQMADYAQQIVEGALSAGNEERPVNPKILELQSQIEYIKEGIKRFGDASGDQTRRIAMLQSEIAQISEVPVDQAISQELLNELGKLSRLDIWRAMSEPLLRFALLKFVDRVVIDFTGGFCTVGLTSKIRFSVSDKGK